MWEGVGVCSYLLVNFWFTRIHANTSAMSAFFTNRVGDWILTVGMFCVAWTFGALDYSTVFSLAPYINVDVITIIGICLLIGAMAKSAQLGKLQAQKKVWCFILAFLSTMQNAGTFSNACESEGYLNLLAFSLIFINYGINLYLVDTYCLLTFSFRGGAQLLIGRGWALGYSNKQAVLLSNSSKVNYIKRYSAASLLRACHSMQSYYYPPRFRYN